MKLTQKHLLKGTRHFEIIDDYIKVSLKPPFKDEETLTVMLTVLNPEPVITGSSLDFTSRVNGEVLLSFYLGKPNADEFNAFITALKQQAIDEYQSFAGLKPTSRGAQLAGNVYAEPPEFDDDMPEQPSFVSRELDAERIAEAVGMLKTHLNSDDIVPLITALEKLEADPQNDTLQSGVVDVFNSLGPSQGAVLTYAPYVGILMSDAPAGSPY